MKTINQALLICLLISACSTREAKKPKSYPEKSPKITTTNPKEFPDVNTEMLALEAGSDLVTEVKFKEGSSVLTEDAKRKLHDLYSKADAKDRDISEVRLLSWADQEISNKKGTDLPEWQQKLAEKRNDALERALKDMDQDLEFKKISMAEQSKGARQSMDEGEFGTKSGSDQSRASHGVVIFVLKKQ